MDHAVVSANVTYPYNGSQGMAYVAQPEGPGQFPVLLVIQEWWGLESHIRDVARRFAAQGYVAVAPDLYHGKVTNEPSEAQKLMMALDQGRAVRELDAAAAYVQQQPYARPGNAGSVGYCMGGGLSLQLACRSQRIGTAVVYYGPNPQNIDEVARIRGPVLGIYGAEDAWIMSGVPALREAMKRHGKSFEDHVYQGAPHAFFNDTSPAYRKQAAEDAWTRTLDFLSKNLKGA
ncbi:MAG: dienelactone hydrolase family protein [Chloroflexi bacterium]|nr:dienelactone hydrolase family protein [Chloroflexota bacterium]